jgi:hypothetical protein
MELIVTSLDEHLRIEAPNDAMTARVRRHLIDSFEASATQWGTERNWSDPTPLHSQSHP